MRKWQYLSTEDTNLKNKSTFLFNFNSWKKESSFIFGDLCPQGSDIAISSTLKDDKKRVASDFHFEAMWLRYGNFVYFWLFWPPWPKYRILIGSVWRGFFDLSQSETNSVMLYMCVKYILKLYLLNWSISYIDYSRISTGMLKCITRLGYYTQYQCLHCITQHCWDLLWYFLLLFLWYSWYCIVVAILLQLLLCFNISLLSLLLLATVVSLVILLLLLLP